VETQKEEGDIPALFSSLVQAKRGIGGKRREAKNMNSN
jgi:hypothetical protein